MGNGIKFNFQWSCFMRALPWFYVNFGFIIRSRWLCLSKALRVSRHPEVIPPVGRAPAIRWAAAVAHTQVVGLPFYAVPGVILFSWKKGCHKKIMAIFLSKLTKIEFTRNFLFAFLRNLNFLLDNRKDKHTSFYFA